MNRPDPIPPPMPAHADLSVDPATHVTDSDTRFRALAALTSDWYWEQDADFRFVHIRDARGVPAPMVPDNRIGMTRWELPHAGVTEAQWAEHRALLNAHQTFHEFEMQRPAKEGGWIWISVSGVPTFDAAGGFKGYWGIGRDITQRKLAEKDLRDSQNQYQDLVEWAPLGLCVHRGGRIVYVNPAAMRIWGAATAQELYGTRFQSRIHPQYFSSEGSRMQSIVDKGLHVPVRQSRYLRMDDRAIDVETQGMPIVYGGAPAVQICIQDIS
ncbi:MAG: hypothetical protein CFE44_19515, partial [Burkholderiales bacterium PBB4]